MAGRVSNLRQNPGSNAGARRPTTPRVTYPAAQPVSPRQNPPVAPVPHAGPRVRTPAAMPGPERGQSSRLRSLSATSRLPVLIRNSECRTAEVLLRKPPARPIRARRGGSRKGGGRWCENPFSRPLLRSACGVRLWQIAPTLGAARLFYPLTPRFRPSSRRLVSLAPSILSGVRRRRRTGAGPKESRQLRPGRLPLANNYG
jgi:hypothetical protein